MIAPVTYERFYDHRALTELLQSWAEQRPDLVTVESIGRSWEGRDIWLVTVTNAASGPAGDKPAFLVEANIHSAELTSSFAALHLLHRLITEHGHDRRVTHLLDTRALYVVPRVNPDGADLVLREGRYIRSSVRPHPGTRDPGLHGRDVDGDGRVLFMRVPDDNGPWKRHDTEPRLLVRRDPDEFGGEYFRLYLEGDIVDYDGATVPVADPYEGLDLGMNFQSDFSDLPEHPRGAGPFSGSEPEIHAMMRAVAARPNITGYVTCHTFGGVHLHPPMNDDEVVPHRDLEVYEEFGAKARELTGYQVMSYDALKHRPYRVKGGQLNWFYDGVGVYAWITEFWNPLHAVGVTGFHPSRWLVDHPIEDDLRLLRWSDEQLGGAGFVDWYSFDHPQLGKVELGGWDLVNFWYNAPFDRIEREVAPHSEWVVFQALASPRLEIRSLESERVAEGTHKVTLVVHNTGWLPTYVTQKALDRRLCAGVTAEISLPADARVLTGDARADLGQLEGRSQARTTSTWWGHDPGTPDRALVEWVVSAPDGATVEVEARHPRAGTARRTLRLGTVEDAAVAPDNRRG